MEKDPDKYSWVQISENFKHHTTGLSKNSQNSNKKMDVFMKIANPASSRTKINYTGLKWSRMEMIFMTFFVCNIADPFY